ncbi:MAG: hydrogenase maturation nickel metallochaperone HypA [Bilifractor sp.]
MHELPLLMGACDLVSDVVRQNQIHHVDAIVLDVGEVSGVIPAFLANYSYIVFEEYDFLKGAKLLINTVRATARCLNCGTEYDVLPYHGKCPTCGSIGKKILTGQDFCVREIRVAEDDDHCDEAADGASHPTNATKQTAPGPVG